MKKIYISLFLLLTCSFAWSQLRTNMQVGGQISTSSAFLDASSTVTWNSAANPNLGKGLIFPRVDLVLFTSMSPTGGSVGLATNYPTKFDGMIVYNTATGAAGIGGTAVSPGFYYYANPTAATVNGGTWVRIGDAVDLSVKEDKINKSTSTTLGTSDELYPTQNAVKTYVDNLTGAVTSGLTNPPTGNTIGDLFYNTTENKLYVYNGTSWVPVDTNTDAQDLTLAGSTLSLTNDATTVDLSSLLGDTPTGPTNPATGNTLGDTFYNTTDNKLYVYNGTSWVPVDTNTDAQDLTLTGSTLSLTNDATTVDLSSLLGDTPTGATPPSSPSLGDTYFNTTDHHLYVYNGTGWVSVDLDAQDLTLTGSTLSLTNDATTVDLSSLLGDTPTGPTNPATGNTLGDTFYNTTDNHLYVYNGTSWVPVDTNTDAQDLTLAGSTLSLTNDATSVDLSSLLGYTPTGATPPSSPSLGDTYFNTTDHHLYVYNGTGWVSVDLDAQDLTLAGSTLSLTNDATTVDLSSLLGDTPTGATNPATGNTLGDTFYNTTDNKLYVYNGTSWVPVDTDDQTLSEILGVNTSAGNAKITNLAEPTSSQDAATKNYVDATVSSGTPDATTAIKGKVQLAGDLTGTADLPVVAANKITTTKIADSNVTYSKIQNTTTSNVVLGRTTAGAGVVEEIATTGTGNVVRADSPTFTGTPTLPTGTVAVTQAPGDNSTKVATTAFVYAASGGAKNWSSITGSAYTLAADDYYVVNNYGGSGSVVNVTLPAPAIEIRGRQFCIINTTAADVQFVAPNKPVGSVVKVDPEHSATFICTGTDWRCITGF